MSTQRISTLARERWDRAAHASHYLRVHPSVMEWMRLLAPPDHTYRFGDPRGGFGGIAVVVDDELREGEWRLQPDADRYGVPLEWGLIGNPECEHRSPADITTMADAEVRFHRYCVCGAHWFDIAPHITYEPVREPAPSAA